MSNLQFVTGSVESLARRISLSGLMSRREADRAILQGVVTVDGQIVRSGCKVSDTSSVFVNGLAVAAPPAEPRLWGLIKPRGVIGEFTKTSSDDTKKYLPDLLATWDKRDLKELGPPKEDPIPSQCVVVNRVPTMGHGLVLLTTDGTFAESLTTRESKVLTTYRLRTASLVDSQLDVLRKWKTGITLPGIDCGPVFVDVEKRGVSQTWLRVRCAETDLNSLFWYRAGIRVNRVNVQAFGPYSVADVLADRQLVRLPIHEVIRHLVPKRPVQPFLIRRPQLAH